MFRYFRKPIWVFDRLMVGCWDIPASNMAVRKEAYMAVGGFNTDLKINEDTDLCRRMKAHGKIKLDMDFLVHTSGRRYVNGFFSGIMHYVTSHVAGLVAGRKYMNRLESIRVTEDLDTYV